MTTFKIKPRDLVARFYPQRRIGQAALADAVAEMTRRGWLTGFHPRPFEWDRTMTFVPQREPWAAVIRYLDRTGIGVVPRGLIESRTNVPLANIGTGLVLSNAGLAILKVDGNNVFIRATTPGLALMAHQTRDRVLEQMECSFLIHVATGKKVPQHQWNEDLRLRVVTTFDELLMDVPGIRDGDVRSDVYSRWTFPAEPHCCCSDPVIPPESFLPPVADVPPAEPDDWDPDDLDPNIPPF